MARLKGCIKILNLEALKFAFPNIYDCYEYVLSYLCLVATTQVREMSSKSFNSFDTGFNASQIIDTISCF